MLALSLINPSSTVLLVKAILNMPDTALNRAGSTAGVVVLENKCRSG